MFTPVSSASGNTHRLYPRKGDSSRSSPAASSAPGP
ncbi:Uncharacterised protein [Mycobacteroides abscessus subsp. abscessus]|nr:Uncharacterised protein [Mycobacteroides abscessus subsp. abscessus]